MSAPLPNPQTPLPDPFVWSPPTTPGSVTQPAPPPPASYADLSTKRAKAHTAPWLLPIILLLVAGILGGGYYYQFYLKRPTGLSILLDLPGFEVDRSIFLVRPFFSELDDIRARYTEELKTQAESQPKPARDREVLERDLMIAKQDATSAEKAMIESRSKLERLEKERADIAVQQSKTMNDFWEKSARNILAEMKEKKAAFESEVAGRAKSLGMTWPDTFTVSEPDTWSAAYRLGVYKLPREKRGAEMVWIKQKLDDWRLYKTDWEKRRSDVREQAKQKQKDNESSILDLLNSIEETRREADKYTGDLQTAKRTTADLERRLTVLSYQQSQKKTVTIDPKKWLDEITSLPERNAIAFAKPSESGTLAIEHLEDRPDVPPGSHQLFLKAKKENATYWGIIPVTISERSTTEVTVKESQLRPIQSFLDVTPTLPTTAP